MLLSLWAVCFCGGIGLGLLGSFGKPPAGAEGLVSHAVAGPGFIASSFLAGPAGFVSAALVLGALAGLLVLARRPVLAGCLGCFGLGMGLGALEAQPTAFPVAVDAALHSDAPVTIDAIWIRTLAAEPAEAAPARAELAILGLSAPLSGALSAGDPVRAWADGGRMRLALSAPGSLARLGPGDRVRFETRLRRSMGLANPGLPDPALAAKARGIELRAFVAKPERIERLAPGGPSVRRWAHRARLALAEVIDGAVPPPRNALLRALVLGERAAGGERVEEGFRAAGAIHALSVSGLHLTAVAAVFFMLLRRALLFLPALALRLRPDLLAAALAIPAVLFYTLVSGEAVATSRAAIMAAVAFSALLVRRAPSPAGAIAVAAGGLLAARPALFVDPSFQLSVVSVIAIAIGAPLVRKRADDSGDDPAAPTRGRRLIGWVRQGAIITVAAFAVTAPLGAHHFAELAPASPLGNLLLVPPVELGIVPLGLFGSVLEALLPPLGRMPLFLADLLCRLVLWMAEGFRRWAPLVDVMSPSGFEAGCLLSGALAGLHVLAQARRSIGLSAVALAALVVGAGSMVYRQIDRATRAGLLVTFLDVGQGDAALVEGPSGFVALVDGGGAIEGVTGDFDPGARVIEPVLRRKGISRIDLVVLSHPHPDHMNGLFHVLETFEVNALWTAGSGSGNPAYDRLLELAERRGIRRPLPRSYQQDGLRIETWGPWLDGAIGAPPGLEANDASLVVRMGYRGRHVFFAGDLEVQGEAELVDRAAGAAGPRSDVLKVPHHGSRTSSSQGLLDVVEPDLAVMSLGRANRFKFPHPDVVSRFRDNRIPVLRTDRHGAVTVQVSAHGKISATCVLGCR